MENIVLGQDASKSTLEVFEFIRTRKIVRFQDLVSGTGLSKRAILYSIRSLREMGLIETQICMNDTRRRFYCLRIPDA
ncbi:MAG: MarR family transcriptional regulator [Candidatus Thermoplasmatota archaeon]|nr:MarR family transcriptional regulator [Candidatus Thermoplasmatota archaeon]